MALLLTMLHQAASQTTEASRATTLPAIAAASIFTPEAPLATPGEEAGAGVAGVGEVALVAFDALLVGVGGVGVGGVGVGGVGVGGEGVEPLVALFGLRRRTLAPVKSHVGYPPC